MTGTRLGAVRAQLMAGLAELPALDGVLVTTGWRVGATERERIYTRNGTFTHTPASMRGALPTARKEAGTFELLIRVEGVGRDLDWTVDRACALGEACEDYIATVRTTLAIYVPGLEWVVSEGVGRMADLVAETGALSLLSYTVAYQARLITEA